MTGYELSKRWFDFCRYNPEKVNPNHTALFFFIIEKWNSLQRPDKLGLPTFEAMGLIGLKSVKTYGKSFDALVDFGMIEVVQKSKNQYTSNIIALVKNAEALTEPMPKHVPKHGQGTGEARTEPVPSQVHYNESIKVLKKEGLKSERIKETSLEKNIKKEKFSFGGELLKLGANPDYVRDWMQVRKNKKATNSETAFNAFIAEAKKSGLTLDEVLRFCIERDWKGFKSQWYQNTNTNNGNTGNLQNTGWIGKGQRAESEGDVQGILDRLANFTID